MTSNVFKTNINLVQCYTDDAFRVQKVAVNFREHLERELFTTLPEAV